MAGVEAGAEVKVERTHDGSARADYAEVDLNSEKSARMSRSDGGWERTFGSRHCRCLPM